MSDSGWIKIHRKIRQSAIWKCPVTWLKVWLSLLLEATYEPSKDRNGCSLPPGSCLITLRSFAEANDLTVSTVRRALVSLGVQGMIAVTSAHNKTMITILNWSTYQDDLWDRGTFAAQERHKNGTRTAQDARFNSYVEEIRNKKEEHSSPIAVESEFALTPLESSGPKAKSKKQKLYSPEFEEWYKLYPRKDGKTGAAKAYAKHSAEVGHDKLITALRTQLPKLKPPIPGTTDYRPYPAKWLNEGHYWNETTTQDDAWKERWKDL